MAAGIKIVGEDNFTAINSTITPRETLTGLLTLGGEVKAGQMIKSPTEIEVLYKIHMTEIKREETLKM